MRCKNCGLPISRVDTALGNLWLHIPGHSAHCAVTMAEPDNELRDIPEFPGYTIRSDGLVFDMFDNEKTITWRRGIPIVVLVNPHGPRLQRSVNKLLRELFPGEGRILKNYNRRK